MVVWWAGAAVGGVAALGALIFGLYALAYAQNDAWLGGYSYGCDGTACVAEHMGAALLCFGSVAVYGLLLAMAPFTSLRVLRAAGRVGLVWAAVTVALSVIGGWPGLVLLAPGPALMGTGSRMRRRAQERYLARSD